jgi:MFS superfamily sulfate permease-like transporter
VRPLLPPWLQGYERAWLGRDALAGLVAACVVVPQAIAYASLAGLPVEVGLYAALLPMVAYAAFGSSRSLSVSVTSTISILTASAIAGTQDPRTAAALLAVLVGVLLAGAGLARIGFLADFISLPILAGYKAGTGLFIISGQLGKLLGVPVDGQDFSSTTSATSCAAWTTSAPPRSRSAPGLSCCCWCSRGCARPCRHRSWPWR